MENLNKRPSKGILRFSESSRSNSVDKDIKWDEANIKDTLHPEDKDYGFMKIDEPSTPYSHSPRNYSNENSEDEDNETRTSELLERARRKMKEPPVAIELFEEYLVGKDLDKEVEPIDGADEAMEINKEAGSSQLSPSMPSSRRSSASSGRHMTDEFSPTGSSASSSFDLKRKLHYNEFHAMKLAKKLMQKELEEDDDDDEDNNDDDEDDDDARMGQRADSGGKNCHENDRSICDGDAS